MTNTLRFSEAEYLAYLRGQVGYDARCLEPIPPIPILTDAVAGPGSRTGRFALALPWPPTLNHNLNGARKLTQSHKDFRERVAMVVLGKRIKPLQGRLSASIVAFPPDKRMRDLDNLLKPIFDALQHAGCFLSDGAIDHIEITRAQGPDQGIVHVSIKEI